MTELNKASGLQAVRSRDARALEVSPGLWAGYGLVRGGAGTALVGSHEQVADLIEEYHRLGFDHFILSGQPHVEEAYHFAEGAAAVLRSRELLAPGRAEISRKVSELSEVTNFESVPSDDASSAMFAPRIVAE